MLVNYFHGLLRFFPLPTKKNDLVFLYVISTAIALLAAFWVYSTQSFELTAFPERIHGGAIAAGINTYIRPTLYFGLLSIFFIIFSCSFSLFSIILKQFSQMYQKDTILFEKDALTSLGSMLIISIVLVVLNRDLYAVQFNIFKDLTIAVACILFLRWAVCLYGKFTFSERLKVKTTAFGFFFLFAAIALSVKVFRLPLDTHVLLHTTTLHKIMLLFFLGWVASIIDKKHIIFKSCAPLILLPLSIIAASETKYIALVRGHTWELSTILLYYTGTLCVLSGVYFICTVRQKTPINSNKVLKYWYLPICLISIAYIVWLDQTQRDNLDLLHPANTIALAQQTIQMGKIPYVDIWHPRGLRDCFTSSIFMLLAGDGSAADSYIWFFVSTIAVYFVVVFALLTKLVRPLYAFLLTLFFAPILTEGTGLYNGLMLLPVLFLPWAMRHLTFKRAAVIWFLTVCVFAWMPSAGKSSFYAIWLVFIIYALQNGKAFFRSVIPAFIAVVGGLGLLYCIILLSKDISIMDRIAELRCLPYMDIGSHAYQQIATPSVFALFYYIGLPLFFGSICVTFIWRRISAVAIPATHWLYLGIATSMLFIFTRTIGRHCLLEHYWLTFSSMLIGLLPLIRPFKQRILFQLWLFIPAIFTIGICGSLILIPSSIFNLPVKNWNEPHRFQYAADYEPVIDFLRTNLKGDETFFEMINGHGLYAYTEKENPLYLTVASMYITDNVQKILVKQLQQRFDKGELPLVVVHSPFWGGRIDDLYSTAIQYRIAEFIYKNYEPYRTIGGFELWAAKGSRFMQEKTPEYDKSSETAITIPITAEGDYVTHDANAKFKKGVLVLKGGMVDPFINNMMTAVNVPPIPLKPSKVLKCELEVTNTVSGALQVYFSFDGQTYSAQHYSEIILPVTKEKITVTLEKLIPTTANELTDLRIDCPNGTTMKIYSLNVLLMKEKIPERLVVEQTYDHKKLAYLWANHDPYQAINNDKLVTLVTDVNIQPYENYDFTVPNYESDNIAEYLHFRIISPEGGSIIGKIRDTKNNFGMFAFTLQKSTEPVDYLVRISSTYAWINKNTFSITSTSEAPITIENLSVLEGD